MHHLTSVGLDFFTYNLGLTILTSQDLISIVFVIDQVPSTKYFFGLLFLLLLSLPFSLSLISFEMKVFYVNLLLQEEHPGVRYHTLKYMSLELSSILAYWKPHLEVLCMPGEWRRRGAGLPVRELEQVGAQNTAGAGPPPDVC